MTTPAQLSQACTTHGLPLPHPLFLTTILSPPPSHKPTTAPLPALLATTKHRLLNASFLTPSTLSPSTPFFPPSTTNPTLTSLILTSDIPIQVIDLLDISRSKGEQIELLEAQRKGEMTKGREVIRVVPELDGESNAAQGAAKKGTYKVWMQDWKGTVVEGFEWKSVDKMEDMVIGCKIMLKKGSRIARGIVLLEPERCVILGGKIEAWDKVWREGREARLRREVAEEASRAGDDIQYGD